MRLNIKQLEAERHDWCSAACQSISVEIAEMDAYQEEDEREWEWEAECYSEWAARYEHKCMEHMLNDAKDAFSQECSIQTWKALQAAKAAFRRTFTD